MAQSVSKKAYNNGNGFGDQAVYDDVFGGPPKIGVPTLSPRLEDYAEIFGSFHASRASAIPIIDLPALDDEADFSLDVRGSSHLDYSQVFGGSSALDFAVSFKELFNQSKKTAYSEEAWSPAQSESLSDESDPSVCSERSWSLSNEGSYQSYYCIKQFNVSHNKASQRSKKDNLTGMTQTPQPHAVPGFTCAVNGSPLSQMMRDRNMPFVVTDDHNPSVNFSGEPGEGNQFRKTMSHQATSFGAPNFGADLKPVTYGRTVSYTKETFVTVTDISLRTQPSNLPPPLRSPPVLAEKDGDSDRLKAKFKARKKISSGETAGDSSPAFLDVEVDACSSAAAVKDAVEKAQTKLTNVKELMEGKKEGVHCRTMLGSVNDAKYKKEKAMEIDLSNCFNEKRAHGTCQRDFIGMKTFSGEERQKVMKAPLVDSDSTEGEKHINVAKISANKKHGKDKLCLECNKSEASVAWRQGAECYQLVETDKSRKNIDQAKDHSVLMQNTQFHEHGQEKKETAALQELEDDNKKIRVDREAIQWDGGKKEISKATKESSRQEKQEMKVYQEGCEQVENEKKRNIAQQKIPAEGDKSEECENLAEVKHKEHGMKVERKLKEATERIEDDKKHKDACEKEENERRLSQTLDGERYEKRLKEATEPAEIEERRNEALDQEERQKQQGESCEGENNENRKKEVHGSKENEKRLKEALEQVDNNKILKKALEREDTEKRVKIDLVQKANQNWLKLPRERDEHEERPLDDLRQQEIERKLKGTLQQGGNGERQKEAHERKGCKERLNEAYEREENEKRLIEAWEQAENKVRLQEACGREESDKRLKEVFKHKEIEKRPEEANANEETQKGIDVAGYSEECMGCGKDHEQYAKDENGRRLKSDRGTCVDADLETFKGSNGAFEVVNVPGEEQFSSFGLTEEDTRNEQNQTRKTYSTESLHLHDGMTESVDGGIGSRQTQREKNEKVSEIASNTTGKPNVLAFELGERGFNVKEAELAFEEEEIEDKFMSSQIVTELVENGRKMETDQTTVLEEKRNAQFITQKVSTRQNTERRGSDLRDILAPEENEKDDSIKKERELEKDHLRKIEEEREREREREKDRMAVDREAPDTRERVFVEAREREARAAVEWATAEVRQRVMVEARERLEKASAEARERSLAETASKEARLRAERAAVERATAEARERAFQKVMNENATFEARERVEGSVADKSSASCNNGGVRQSSSFSDPQEVRCQGFGSSTSSNSRRFVEVEGESEHRCKARLERHQRTAERAAKALAEKNMCDLLALKEQAERNRLAEALDADVKRWSGGKKGNLRALLSTLQYILGPDSGWQPIPLTEVITSAAVKKAYRKATLCVHPDKLQQRGASVQQKYLCEKVFDLLKEAWNKFNSEER